MFDLITIGDTTVDTTLILDDTCAHCTMYSKKKVLAFEYAQKIPITKGVDTVGGNAANVAVGADKLGLHTAIYTEIGNDPRGIFVHDELGKKGIDTRYIKLLKGQHTRYSIVLNYQAERTILSKYEKRNYSVPKLEKGRFVYFTSLGPGTIRVAKKVEQYKKKNPDTTLIVSPGSYQITHTLASFRNLLGHADILMCNKEEAETINGRKVAVKGLLNSIKKKFGLKHVFITDSINGSYSLSEDGKAIHMPVFPIKPISKTGAGDAYASGVIAALSRGLSIPDCMRWGTANSGGVIKEVGAQAGLQNVRKINASLKKYPKVSPETV